MNLETARKRYIPMTETMFYILLSLREERHGYGIMQHVQELTQGRLTLGAGTIYQSLGKLSGDELISATSASDRQKRYRITETGEKILLEEANRIRELYQSVEEML